MIDQVPITVPLDMVAREYGRGMVKFSFLGKLIFNFISDKKVRTRPEPQAWLNSLHPLALNPVRTSASDWSRPGTMLNPVIVSTIQ